MTFFPGMFTTAFRREARRWRGWFKERLSKMGLYTSTPNTAIEQEFFKWTAIALACSHSTINVTSPFQFNSFHILYILWRYHYSFFLSLMETICKLRFTRLPMRDWRNVIVRWLKEKNFPRIICILNEYHPVTCSFLWYELRKLTIIARYIRACVLQTKFSCFCALITLTDRHLSCIATLHVKILRVRVDGFNNS